MCIWLSWTKRALTFKNIWKLASNLKIRFQWVPFFLIYTLCKLLYLKLHYSSGLQQNGLKVGILQSKGDAFPGIWGQRGTSPECSFPECHRQKQVSQVTLLYQFYPVHCKIAWAPVLWHGQNWLYLYLNDVCWAEITFVDLVFRYQVRQMAVMILKSLSSSPKANT